MTIHVKISVAQIGTGVSRPLRGGMCMEDGRVVSKISLIDGDTHPTVVTMVRFDNFPSPVVVMDRFCTNPDCDCRDTNLIFYETVNKKLGGKLFEIKINVDSWETVSYQAMRRNADCEDMYREFISDIDEITKLKIKKRFEDGKKFGGDFLKETIDFDIRQGETLCYAEIFNSPHYDRFLIEYNGTNYVVLDSYCTNPKCNCNDVSLTFYEMDSSDGASSFSFALQSKFKPGKYKIVDTDGQINDAEIKELYDCFMERLDDPGFVLLKNRYTRMKNLSTALGLDRTPATNGHHAVSDKHSGKVARNEPCPCGSGKKYKKCCGKQ